MNKTPLFSSRRHGLLPTAIVSLSCLAVLLLSASCCQPAAPAGNGTASSVFTGEQPDYDTYFTPERLRIDLVLAGGAGRQLAFVQELYCESEWAGSPNGLVDPFGYGQYYMEVFSKDGQVIYSKGFSTYFEEWRTTNQAGQLEMACNQTVWMPFPKDSVRLQLYQRLRATNRFEPL